MKLEWKADQKEQIKLGIDPTETVTVDVDLKALTQEQRDRLAAGHAGKLVEGTQNEVIASLQAAIDADNAKIEAERAKVETAANADFDTRQYYEYRHGVKVEWTGYAMPYLYVDHRVKTNYADLLARYNERSQEANRLTDAAKAEAFVAAADAIEAGRLAEEDAEAEKKQVAAAALAAKKARRAEINAIEISITRGDRDWGTPWGAVVRAVRGRDTYDFDASEYDLGTETLTIRCQPGDVIAWGQKNFRKPKRTIHERRRIAEDWWMVSV